MINIVSFAASICLFSILKIMHIREIINITAHGHALQKGLKKEAEKRKKVIK